MKKIAIDVEGVLADSQSFASGIVDNDEMQEWGFSSKEVEQIFLDALTDGWHNHWKDIDLVSKSAPEYVSLLNDTYGIDIVTARTNADEEIMDWLNYHDIPYEGFVSTKTYKEHLGYDIYIDDNPHMTEKDINLYLHDQPWNKSADPDNRVYSVEEAAKHIISNDNNIDRVF